MIDLSSRQRPRAARWPAAGVVVLVLLCRPGAAQTPPCTDWVGEIVATEGTVERQPQGSATWSVAAVGERMCRGDTLRVYTSGRAMLRLADESTLRLDANTTVVLGEPEAADDGLLINLLRGLIHVISRDPRQLHFTTPFANAGLEGTEFDIRVDAAEGRTEVAVLEGAVKVTNRAGEVSAPAGNLVSATTATPPTATPLPAPIELMRWASYYPLIVDAPLPAADQAPSPAEARDAEFFARRAAARLDTARLEPARLDIDRALALQPEHATALALQALLALARSDMPTAQAAVERALRSDERSAPALVARSHVAQAAGELAAAEAAARAALAAEPSNAVALTRLADLLLGRADVAASEQLAERARSLAPQRSAPLVVLGFAKLAAFETAAAGRLFDAATALEPEAPLPRLGRAIATAQSGDIVAGRRELELAVAADPTSGLARSYMAKLYAAENRDDLTLSQLELAKSFDPGDTTPWLYSALHDLRRNRPIEALHELRGARSRNDYNAVFRSRLVLDEDLATRSAALGRIYTGIGFGRLALLDAWQAVDNAPADHTGHRLLADLYSAEPRHEIARVSELLLAQLLQPANVTPIKPQLGQPSRFIAQRIGPSQSSFDEFTLPIASNGPKLSASAVGGANGTVGTEVTVAGLNDGLSYSAGLYRFATEGFRANNDSDQQIGNVFLQFRPSHATSLQAELRSVRSDQGDLAALFDPSLYSQQLRGRTDADSLRLGAHHRLSRNDSLLASVIYQESFSGLALGSTFAVDTDRDGYSADVQYLHSGNASRLQSGILYADQDERGTQRFGAPFPPSEQRRDNDLSQLSAYAYWHYDVASTLTLTVGGSFDRVVDVATDEAFNPKLGLTWRPAANTTVRAAAFETLFGSLTSSTQNVQPRLEPVQVAGFTQVLFGGQADSATVQGLAIDHSVSENVFVGWEATLRDTQRAVFFSITGSVGWTELEERTQLAYALWTPTDRLSLSARYEHGRYATAPERIFGYTAMKLQRLPLEVRFFARSGFSAGARATFVRQTGTFQQRGSSPFAPNVYAPGEDNFGVLDAFVGYRLPNRRGLVSLNADNLLDERFRFQDVDPTDSTLIPERLLSIRFTLAFD